MNPEIVYTCMDIKYEENIGKGQFGFKSPTSWFTVDVFACFIDFDTIQHS